MTDDQPTGAVADFEEIRSQTLQGYAGEFLLHLVVNTFGARKVIDIEDINVTTEAYRLDMNVRRDPKRDRDIVELVAVRRDGKPQ